MINATKFRKFVRDFSNRAVIACILYLMISEKRNSIWKFFVARQVQFTDNFGGHVARLSDKYTTILFRTVLNLPKFASEEKDVNYTLLKSSTTLIQNGIIKSNNTVIMSMAPLMKVLTFLGYHSSHVY